MRIIFLPYTKIDGVPTLTDSELMSLYDRMERDGTAQVVFYDGSVQNRTEFLQMMTSGANLLYFVMRDDDIVGFAYLNHLEGKIARLHFCFFSEVWGHVDEIVKLSMKILHSMKDEDGSPLFRRFIGYLPTWNRPAINLVERVGGKVACTIPDLIWDHAKQKSVEGAIVYYKNEEEDEDLHKD